MTGLVFALVSLGLSLVLAPFFHRWYRQGKVDATLVAIFWVGVAAAVVVPAVIATVGEAPDWLFLLPLAPILLATGYTLRRTLGRRR